MEKLFAKLKIINDLSKITLKYLTITHIDILSKSPKKKK